MIIGNGAIAKALAEIEVPQDLIVHAAGVSNSMCEDRLEFARDLKRLDLSLKLSKKIIYFSSQTCSNSSVLTPYFEHKRTIERKILSDSDEHLIVRLPQFCSKASNAKNMIRSFLTKVKNNEGITCYDNVTRNLITDTDLRSMFCLLLVENHSGILSFGSPYSYKPVEIISEIERVLSTEAVIKFEESPHEKFFTRYQNSNEFRSIYREMEKIGRSSYLSKLIDHVCS
jgi:hypothetical protein